MRILQRSRLKIIKAGTEATAGRGGQRLGRRSRSRARVRGPRGLSEQWVYKQEESWKTWRFLDSAAEHRVQGKEHGLCHMESEGPTGHPGKVASRQEGRELTHTDSSESAPHSVKQLYPRECPRRTGRVKKRVLDNHLQD